MVAREKKGGLSRVENDCPFNISKTIRLSEAQDTLKRGHRTCAMPAFAPRGWLSRHALGDRASLTDFIEANGEDDDHADENFLHVSWQPHLVGAVAEDGHDQRPNHGA